MHRINVDMFERSTFAYNGLSKIKHNNTKFIADLWAKNDNE